MKKALALSTICTSLALAASPPAADTLPLGCFARHYTPAHLASQPEQVVEAIWLDLQRDDLGIVRFTISSLMAGQGHAGREGLGGTRLHETGACRDGLTCHVECDGGGFEVTRLDGDSIDITTSYMRLASEGCSGEGVFSDLSEGPRWQTTYRLTRADPSACAPN
jgi:hypothetical protein